MLITIEEANTLIDDGKYLLIAGEEDLLKKIKPGKWIGGTIPYFMGKDGGVLTKEKIFVNTLPENVSFRSIKLYNEGNISNITEDASDNGFSIIIIPAASKVHVEYAENASNYKDFFLKPIIGWISGVDLSDLGKKSAKVISGENALLKEDEAVVIHFDLPKGKQASIGIINLFSM